MLIILFPVLSVSSTLLFPIAYCFETLLLPVPYCFQMHVYYGSVTYNQPERHVGSTAVVTCDYGLEVALEKYHCTTDDCTRTGYTTYPGGNHTTTTCMATRRHHIDEEEDSGILELIVSSVSNQIYSCLLLTAKVGGGEGGGLMFPQVSVNLSMGWGEVGYLWSQVPSWSLVQPGVARDRV